MSRLQTTDYSISATPQEALLNVCGVENARQQFCRVFKGDARDLANLQQNDKEFRQPITLPARCIDLIVTSPPYWKKRDYGYEGQIGQEARPSDYVDAIIACMSEWRRVLRASGSIFLNIGDTYWRKGLQGIPSLVEAAARNEGWSIRNRIIWVKKGGMPDPVRDRLANRHEYILHFVVNSYYYDLFGYAEVYSVDKRGANPGDVWEIAQERGMGRHLAPFPKEIVRRAILLACPQEVCIECGKPRRRIVERTYELDMNRPQARRALEIATSNNLTAEHFDAIRATGISDAGKARSVQSGTDRNSERVQALAREAKAVLGGYFREFTFAKRKSVGWTKCDCGSPFIPGVVLDPFMGTGTTLEVALDMGCSAIGIDLDVSQTEGKS